MRERPEAISEIVHVNILDTIKDLHLNINLSAEYFVVQGIAFLHSISEGYGFRTVENIKILGKEDNKAKMLKGIKKCINIYHSRGL